MSAEIKLTNLEQHEITIALRLEHAGFTEAAKWVRSQIEPLRGIDFEKNEVITMRVEDIFSIHRGSLPPHEKGT